NYVYLQCLTAQQVLSLEHLDQGARDVTILRYGSESRAGDMRARGGRLAELDGGLPFGGRANDAHAVRASLLNRARHLAQSVDDLFFDLADHARVTEVDFPDVNATDAIAPLL